MLFAVCGHSFADYTLALEGAFLGLLIELYYFLVMCCSGRILEDVGQLLCVEVSGWLLSFGTLGSDAKYLVLQALFPVCLKLFGMGFSPFLLVGQYLFLILLVIGVLILPSFLRIPFLVLPPLFGVLGIPLLAIRFHLLFMFEIIGVASGTDLFCSFFQGHIA